MTILQAMSDPELFAPAFKRSRLSGDTWQPWRTFLAALFGLGLLENADVETYQKHTGRTDVQLEPYRECFCICGRRAGKSLVAALVATYLAVFKDHSYILAPGETGTIMILASDRRQARVVLGYTEAFFAIPMLSRLVSNRLKESIELTNRVRIEVHTSSFRAVRGYTVLAAILDEMAFWSTEDSANPDVEVLNALRPAMATVPGALLLAISSPYARRGALWQAWREYYGKAGASTLVWQAKTRAMNRTVSKVTVAAAYLQDPASAAAEYGAQFRTDVESFIPLETVRARTVEGRFELAPVAGLSYVAFCDPSGGQSDSMTLGIAHVELERGILDVLREVRAPFSPETVVAEFADLLKKYRISEVTGDRYAGEWPAEQFAKRNITYRPSERSRSEIYLDLLPALMSGQVELLDNPRLAAQLVSLERRTARGGRDSVDHAPGGHDDVANSAAGALVLALASVCGGVLGVVDYLKGVDAGRIDPEAKSPVAPVMIRPSVAPKVEQPGACPACGSICIVPSSGAGGMRCNQCGASFGARKSKIVYAGFKGVIER